MRSVAPLAEWGIYTLAFFRVRTSHQNRSKEPGYERRLYRELHEQFFHAALKDPRTARFMKLEGDFHTSPMKIIDNPSWIAPEAVLGTFAISGPDGKG